MCGRFPLVARDELGRIIEAVERGRWQGDAPDWPARRIDAFPGLPVPVIAAARAQRGSKPASSDHSLGIIDMTWGYEVDWKKGAVFNARIEKALSQKGIWADSLAHRRCLVPAWGFYEPHRKEAEPSRAGRRIKRQYLFALPSRTPLLLAGIYEAGRFAVVTCPPNEWASPIHDRMPLALRVEEAAAWLAGPPSSLAALADRSSLKLDSLPESDADGGKQAGSAPFQMSFDEL